jgi:hypothetical protein
VKYVLLIAGFLLAASSGVLALARNSGGMMGRGCMQMMRDMHPGVTAISMMDRMMDGMGGMMWGAGLLWLLLSVLVLAAAVPVKYLRSDRGR